MEKHTLEKRMAELEIYGDFYFRKELKPLAAMLQPDETLNCILTGVYDGQRRMLAVTDNRIIIILAGALGAGEVKVIKKEAVKGYEFLKKFPFSSVRIDTPQESLLFKNTQGSLKELFEWAMKKLSDGSDSVDNF